jgi:hypothetical protein
MESQNLSQSLSLSLPKEFLQNLSTVIFKHDILFLQEICNELNIPFREMKAKILGMGTTTQMAISTEFTGHVTQCCYWVQSKSTAHWIQCPDRQILGLTSCAEHNKHPSRGRLRSDFTANPMNYIINKKTKEPFMYEPKSKRLFHLNDNRIDGILWTAPDGTKWILLNTPRHYKKIDKGKIQQPKLETIENV